MKAKLISPNNIVIEHSFTGKDEDKLRWCQSYDKIIAFDTGKKIILDTDFWNFSAPINKHRCAFLCETMKETIQKIKDGTYKMENLNK